MQTERERERETFRGRERERERERKRQRGTIIILKNAQNYLQMQKKTPSTFFWASTSVRRLELPTLDQLSPNLSDQDMSQSYNTSSLEKTQ